MLWAILGKALLVYMAARTCSAALALHVPLCFEPLCLLGGNTSLGLEGKGEISGDSTEGFLFLHPSISQ